MVSRHNSFCHTYFSTTFSFQKSLCDTNCIESCLRELRELADSGDVNYSGDIFIQLRRQLLQHSPDLLTDEDLRFVSPVKGRGETEEELEDSFERNLWEVSLACQVIYASSAK